MNRNEKVLKYISKNSCGIEIGPSHNPIAPKKEGYNVHIIDHMNRKDLISKYKEHSVNLDNIEDVDFVWNGESYNELTGNSKYYDWIIASHVIEHTPDLIGFLNDCDSILKDDGMLSLVVPDKRFCFDYHRPITGISKIIDSHFQKNKIHTPGTITEYFLNVVSKEGNIAWDSFSIGKFNFIHDLNDVQHYITKAVEEKEYIDVHSWVFVPNSFRLIIQDLYTLGFIQFKEVIFFPTVGCEFYITLSRKGKNLNKSRIEILEDIQSEIESKEFFNGNQSNNHKNRFKSIFKWLKS